MHAYMHVLWFRSLSTSTILFYMLSSLLFKLLLPVLQVEVSCTCLSNGRREKQDIKDDTIWFCSNPNLGLYFPLFTHNSTCLIIYANGCNALRLLNNTMTLETMQELEILGIKDTRIDNHVLFFVYIFHLRRSLLFFRWREPIPIFSSRSRRFNDDQSMIFHDLKYLGI